MPGADFDILTTFKKPLVVHVAHFGEGTMDLAWCKEQLLAGSWVTIESPTNAAKQLQEIEHVRG